MQFKELSVEGAYLITLDKHEDERGYFSRSWCLKEFSEQGITFNPEQANIAYSYKKGTLRGMHYQKAPHAEAKLIRCVRGAIYDASIDLRPDSATYRQWVGLELKGRHAQLLFIPEGLAHGYQTLEDNTEIYYQVSHAYTPTAEMGIRWNDPEFQIEWPITKKVILSEKDKRWPDFHN